MSSTPNGERRAADPDRPALRRCISIAPDRFAADYWSTKPLLSRATELPAPFADLLTLAAVDELVSRRGLRTPFLRLAKDGQVIDAGRYTRPGGAGAQIGDQVSDERVLSLFADGATLVLQGLHRLWPPLIDFAAALVADLGHPVQVNAYVTPPQSQGFSDHYDVHDVFVLQVAGTKRWIVHAPVFPSPLRSQPWTDHRSAVAAAAGTEPEIDVVLQPGDALYLPRGWLHAAQAQGEVCAHLTVGVHTLTRYAVVEAVLALAADEEGLRTSLPLGIDVADPAAMAAPVKDTVVALQSWLPTADPDAASDRLRQTVWSAVRPSPIAPIEQATAARTLSTATRIRLRPHLRLVLHEDVTEAVLVLTDRKITFPAATRPALTVLLAAPTAVGDLPGLTEDEQLTLVRRLLREAVVVVDPTG